MSISNKAYTFPAQADGSPERKVSLSSVEAGEFMGTNIRPFHPKKEDRNYNIFDD